MRKYVLQTYNKLQTNSKNYIVYFERNKRFVKTFSEFHRDVEANISRLNYLKKNKPVENVAILGPTSYEWMVFDFACMIGGYRSIALPETYSQENIDKILKEVEVDILLCDFSLKDQFLFNGVEKYYYRCYELQEKDFEKLDQLSSNKIAKKHNNIREDYTIVFSSGTSENIKKITWSLPGINENRTFLQRLKLIFHFISYKFSFWPRSNNKVIIFMPFSHPINRVVANNAFAQKINIVLSDPKNALKHLIKEKPNIMFTIPLVYDAIAQNIKLRINKFSRFQKTLFTIFNRLKINTLSNKNPIKQLFSIFLFRKIKKIYGGRADHFVSGSAPIDPEVLKIFYSIGVKVYEAYGQTESSNIMSSGNNFRIGSVGKPKKGKAKISDEGELLLKYKEKNHSSNKDILNVKEGWIHTGDLAYFDKDGFLFITGRKDDMIVLDNGKKVNPHKIERIVTRQDYINHALVFSKDTLSVSIVIDLKDQKKEIANNINDMLVKINNSLASYEQIKNFSIANEHFTVENGLLTGTMKMKRKSIIDKYKDASFERIN